MYWFIIYIFQCISDETITIFEPSQTSKLPEGVVTNCPKTCDVPGRALYHRSMMESKDEASCAKVERWWVVSSAFLLSVKRIKHTPPKNQHGTRKSSLWQGKSSSKPALLGSMLVFWSVSCAMYSRQTRLQAGCYQGILKTIQGIGAKWIPKPRLEAFSMAHWWVKSSYMTYVVLGLLVIQVDVFWS